MGWFWSATNETQPAAPSAAAATQNVEPPAGCPMHKRTIDALIPPSHKQQPSSSSPPPPSSCPVPHASPSSPPSSCPVNHAAASSAQPPKQAQDDSSFLSKINPLNYMFHSISQAPAPHQTQALPTSREESSIPRADSPGANWEYPSPQQMYNALLRKGYTDTDVTAVEDMVAVHNFLNEGAWAEIVEWERRFGKGLARGWQACKRGEANSETALRLMEMREGGRTDPTLVRFQGRPKDMTPRAVMFQVLGWLYPSKYATEPPFDRHDWFVARNIDGKETQVRYVIDYYAGPPEPTGEPVFFLDVRPAVTVTGACERMIRWGGDVWYKGSGAEVREEKRAQQARGS